MRQFMSGFFNTLFADKIILLSFMLAISILLTTLFLILLFYKQLPPLLPLFNQLPWGETRLGTKEQLFIPFAIASIILFTNPFLCVGIYKEMPLVSRILSISAFIVALLTLLFTIRTIRIVL